MLRPLAKTFLTHRARHFATPPLVGMLIQKTPTRPAYRIALVTRLCLAGDERGHRFRVVAERLCQAPPPGEQIHPWPAPPIHSDPAPDHCENPLPIAAVLLVKMRLAAAQTLRSQMARAARVGRDRGFRGPADLGHGLLLDPVRDRAGAILREPMVAIDKDAADPAAPTRRLCRARKIDPMQVLLTARSIAKRHYEAGEQLREHAEASEPYLGSNAMGKIFVDGGTSVSITDRQIHACWKLRLAWENVPPDNRRVIEWIVLDHGTVAGFARHTHRRHAAIAGDLRCGLESLADHYFGRQPTERAA